MDIRPEPSEQRLTKFQIILMHLSSRTIRPSKDQIKFTYSYNIGQVI